MDKNGIPSSSPHRRPVEAYIHFYAGALPMCWLDFDGSEAEREQETRRNERKRRKRYGRGEMGVLAQHLCWLLRYFGCCSVTDFNFGRHHSDCHRWSDNARVSYYTTSAPKCRWHRCERRSLSVSQRQWGKTKQNKTKTMMMDDVVRITDIVARYWSPDEHHYFCALFLYIFFSLQFLAALAKLFSASDMNGIGWLAKWTPTAASLLHSILKWRRKSFIFVCCVILDILIITRNHLRTPFFFSSAFARFASIKLLGLGLIYRTHTCPRRNVCQRAICLSTGGVYTPQWCLITGREKRAKCYVSLWSLSRSRVIYVGPTCDAFRAGDTSRARLAHSRLCCWQTKELVSPKRANDWSKRLLSGPRPSIIEKQQPIPTLKGTGLLIRCPLIRLFH